MNVSSLWLELSPTPFTLGYANAGGVRTRYIEAGAGDPLVLLHGTGGHLEAYARNIAPLAEHFRVIAYDMLGHGYTDHPDKPYTVDVLADHLVDFMDAMGLDRPIVSGESLGGWVAAWTAAHHPARVRGAILNTPGNISSKPEVMTKLRESSIQAARDAATRPESVRARVEWLFHDTSQVSDEIVETRRRIYTQPDYVRTMENTVALQDPEIRKKYIWDPAWLNKITCPTLIMWTSHDPTGTIEEGKILGDWISTAELHVIDGAGHWPQWEKTDEFNQLHRDFLHRLNKL